jgi:hypothetical protein
MNTVESFRATIWFGLLFQAGTALAAVIVGNHLALMLIVAGAGLSYLTQALNTTACIISDRALLSEGAAQQVLNEQAYRYSVAGMWLWGAALTVCLSAYCALMVP